MRVARDDDDDGHVLVDERDGPVLHLARRVPLGVDVRDLLELERALERDREPRAAPEEEHVLGAHVLLRERADVVGLREHVAHLLRRPRERLEDAPRLALRERPAAPAEVDREQEHRHELRREALRRRDADLGAGVRVERSVARARDRAVEDVGDREDVRALGLGGLHRGERVERLAALAHGDDEVGLGRRPARGSAPRCRSRRPPGCARAARPSSARPSPRASSCRTRRSRRAGSSSRPRR